MFISSDFLNCIFVWFGVIVLFFRFFFIFCYNYFLVIMFKDCCYCYYFLVGVFLCNLLYGILFFDRLEFVDVLELFVDEVDEGCLWRIR